MPERVLARTRRQTIDQATEDPAAPPRTAKPRSATARAARGILGVVIREAVALRLHDLGENPRSLGFPPGHAPMRSLLGVPILLCGVAYGNLYPTEREDGEDFEEADEELVLMLANQVRILLRP